MERARRQPDQSRCEALAALKSGHHIRIGGGSAAATAWKTNCPFFRYEMNGALVEHRVFPSDSPLVQKFVVKNASAETSGQSSVTKPSKPRDASMPPRCPAIALEMIAVMVPTQCANHR